MIENKTKVTDSNTEKKPKDNLTRRIWAAGIPIIAYPFCLIANVMSIAGARSENTPILLTIIATVFLWGSTAYPLFYVGSLLWYFIGKRSKLAVLFIEGYLMIVLVSFFLWLIIDLIN